MNADDRPRTATRAGVGDPVRRLLLTGGAAMGATALAALLADPRVAWGQGVQDQDLTTEDMIGKSLRVYHTGDPVTMDYSEDRLNVELGPDDRIVRVWVG